MKCPQCKQDGASEILKLREPERARTWFRCAHQCSGDTEHVFPVKLTYEIWECRKDGAHRVNGEMNRDAAMAHAGILASRTGQSHSVNHAMHFGSVSVHFADGQYSAMRSKRGRPSLGEVTA